MILYFKKSFFLSFRLNLFRKMNNFCFLNWVNVKKKINYISLKKTKVFFLNVTLANFFFNNYYGYQILTLLGLNFFLNSQSSILFPVYLEKDKDKEGDKESYLSHLHHCYSHVISILYHLYWQKKFNDFTSLRSNFYISLLLNSPLLAISYNWLIQILFSMYGFFFSDSLSLISKKKLLFQNFKKNVSFIETIIQHPVLHYYRILYIRSLANKLTCLILYFVQYPFLSILFFLSKKNFNKHLFLLINFFFFYSTIKTNYISIFYRIFWLSVFLSYSFNFKTKTNLFLFFFKSKFKLKINFFSILNFIISAFFTSWNFFIKGETSFLSKFNDIYKFSLSLKLQKSNFGLFIDSVISSNTKPESKYFDSGSAFYKKPYSLVLLSSNVLFKFRVNSIFKKKSNFDLTKITDFFFFNTDYLKLSNPISEKYLRTLQIKEKKMKFFFFGNFKKNPSFDIFSFFTYKVHQILFLICFYTLNYLRIKKYSNFNGNILTLIEKKKSLLITPQTKIYSNQFVDSKKSKKTYFGSIKLKLFNLLINFKLKYFSILKKKLIFFVSYSFFTASFYSKGSYFYSTSQKFFFIYSYKFNLWLLNSLIIKRIFNLNNSTLYLYSMFSFLLPIFNKKNFYKICESNKEEFDGLWRYIRYFDQIKFLLI